MNLRTAIIVIGALAVTACTPAEISAWEQVHDLEPGTATRAGDAVVAAQAGPPVPMAPPHTSPPDPVLTAIRGSFPGQVAKAHAIARCESRLNPRAVSPTNDHGLFQINKPTWNRPGHPDPVADWIGRHWADVYDPHVNAEMARRIVDAYGWRMWACHR